MQPNKDNVDPEIINLAETADKKDLELSKAEADPAPEVLINTRTISYRGGQLEKNQSTPTLLRGNSRRLPTKLLNRQRLRKSTGRLSKPYWRRTPLEQQDCGDKCLERQSEENLIQEVVQLEKGKETLDAKMQKRDR